MRNTFRRWSLFLVICSCLALPALGQRAAAGADGRSTNWLRFYDRFPTVRHLVVSKAPTRHTSHVNLEAFPLNIALFHAINGRRCAFMDYLCIAVLFLGSGWIVLPVVVAAAIFRRRVVPVLLVALAIETLAVMLLKEWLHQPRPAGMLGDLYFVEWLKSGSLPSGDTAMAFVIAWVLQRGAHPALRTVLLLCAVLVAYERVYFGAHFPLDVVVGAGLGIAAAALTEHIFKRRSGAPSTPAPEETMLTA